MATRGSRRSDEIEGRDGSAADSLDIDVEDRDPRPRPPRRSRRERSWSPRTVKALRIARWAGLGLAGLTAVGVTTAIVLFAYFGSDSHLPKIEHISDYHPRQLVRVLDRDGKLIGEIGTERRTLVPLSQIPKVFLDAVVAAEDPSFYQHGGLDYRGILRAAFEDLRQGRLAQGGSTITQQVVKQMLGTPQKTVRRKIQEAILARRISGKLTKQEILEIYVNENNYGHGRYGCQEAARYYFGKPISEVTLAEAALLAGLPQGPTVLSPRRHPEAAKRRQVYVLDQMARQGYIPRAEAERLAGQPIVLAPEPPSRTEVAPEAVAAVNRRLFEKYGDRLPTLGATVKTTIDRHLQ